MKKITRFISWLTRSNFHTISILDGSWEVIEDDVDLIHVPRIGEYVWLDDHALYYKVINVVSSIRGNMRQVLIITEPINLDKIEGSETTGKKV